MPYNPYQGFNGNSSYYGNYQLPAGGTSAGYAGPGSSGQTDPTQYNGGSAPISGATFGSNVGYNGQATNVPTGQMPQGPGVSGPAVGYQPGQPGLAGTAGAAPGGYAFAPGNGQIGSISDFGGAPGTNAPSYGMFNQSMTPDQGQQMAGQKWSITNDPNYNNYMTLGTAAQGAGLYGQNVLNDPNAAAALKAQQAQAGGPSTGQLSAGSYQNSALANLQNAAAGNGPTAADIQGQKSISDAMHAQLTAGASARGGAYQQAGAMQQAGANAANIQAQGAGNAAALRAQEMQAAQGQYAQAAGQAVTGANQAFVGQSNALNQATGAAQNEQGMGLNYYNQLAGLYNQQSGQAAQLASNQIANNYGLSGTQLTTGTQQNIANQQTQQQYVGAGIAAAGMIAAAAASTGGAQAAAKGAREHGASEHEAAAIGTHVGQALGMARLGPTVAHAAKPADTAAAKRGAMTADEMHAAIAHHRASYKKAAALPGPETEPMAAHAYAAGSHLAQLAKMHAAQQHGRTHAVNGRP